MAWISNKRDVNRLIEIDKIFLTIHKQYGAPPNWNRPEGFITLSKIILEQQVSLESAKAHFNKLNGYIPSFTPKEILKLSDEEMRACQISRQKAKYLRALSTAVLDGSVDLEKLRKMPEPEVRELLKTVKGIGDWTVDVYLMFSLQAKDIFPIGDIAVIASVKELTRIKTREGILSRTEKWKPYRSLASFFLWHYYLRKRNREG